MSIILILPNRNYKTIHSVQWESTGIHQHIRSHHKAISPQVVNKDKDRPKMEANEESECNFLMIFVNNFTIL